MKVPRMFKFAAVALLAVFAIAAVTSPAPAQTTGDQVNAGIQQAAAVTTQSAAILSNGKVSSGVITGANVAGAVAPAIGQTIDNVSAAKGDSAAVISATADGIAKVTAAAAPLVPPPWGAYLALASIIANIFQAFFHHNAVKAVSENK